MPRSTRSTRNSVVDYDEDAYGEVYRGSRRQSNASSAISPTSNTRANSEDVIKENGKRSKNSQSFAIPNRKNPRRESRKESVEVDMELADPLKFIQTAAKEEELQEWKGWCELESEPAFFNVMLREMGAEGVKVQELYSLDEEMMHFVPQPIYGVIFLYKFKEDDQFKQEPSCPEHIWFANQTTDNACATISLLNLIMNAEGVEIGPTLESLKEFTKEMTPPLRGYNVTNHDFLRRIHNSFSRRMDMLVSDAWLENAAESRQNTRGGKKTVEENENGFHFTAFVPIRGEIWKLDGLDRQPARVSTFDEDENWINIIAPHLQTRMEDFGEAEIQFNLLAVCKSPLIKIKADFADNALTLRAIKDALDRKKPDWLDFIPEDALHNHVYDTDNSFGLTEDIFAAAKADAKILKEIRKANITAERLLELFTETSYQQKQIKKDDVGERGSIMEDNQTATARRTDLTPLINTWIAKLAEEGLMQELCEKHAKQRDFSP